MFPAEKGSEKIGEMLPEVREGISGGEKATNGSNFRRQGARGESLIGRVDHRDFCIGVTAKLALPAAPGMMRPKFLHRRFTKDVP